MFKWKLNYKIFDIDNNNFDPAVKEIIDTLLEIIKDNEEFNEKKMMNKGSLAIFTHDINADPNGPAGSRNVNKPNDQIYYQNLEYRIHVDEYDFTLLAWSLLIEQISSYLGGLLTRQEVIEVCAKQRIIRQPNNNDMNEENNGENINQNQQAGDRNNVMKMREIIILKFFNLFTRVEFKIREAGENSLRMLLKYEHAEKEILPQAVLEQAFSPIISFLKNKGEKGLNENLMHSLNRLFQLFRRCFNTRILYDTLKEYVGISIDQLKKDSMMGMGMVARDLQRETETTQIDSIYKMFLLLNLITNEINIAIMQGMEIENTLQTKNVYYYSIRPKLIKILDQIVSSSTITQYTKNKLLDDGWFGLILEGIKKNECYMLRERLTREDMSDYMRKLRQDQETGKITDEEYNKLTFRWTKIILELAKKLPVFISKNPRLLHYYKDALCKFLSKPELFEDKIDSLIGVTRIDQITVYLKLLVELVSHGNNELSEERMDVIFMLVDISDMKTGFYINFIKIFFKKTIPQTFTDNQKQQILLRYLSLLSNTEEQRSKEYNRLSPIEHYLRLVSTILVQPILGHIFENGDIDNSILSNPDFVRVLKDKIVMFTEEKNNLYPSYMITELTLFLDYIVSKIDFRALEKTSSSQSISINKDLLPSFLLFSWRNIVRKYEPSKLLINLSKLLASKLKSRSTVLDEAMNHIQELYSNVLRLSEDISDEENKNIWIAICDVLLPEVQRANGNFGPKSNTVVNEIDKDKWFDEFISSKKNSDPIHTQSREDYANINRWWIVIFRNRTLMKPYRLRIIDGVKMYSFLTNSIRINPKHMYILIDIFLIFITWYIEDYKTGIEVRDRLPFDSERPQEPILELTTQKEDFLICLIIDLLKKEEEGYGPLMNRAYLLFRLYTLFIGKDKIPYDNFINFIAHAKKRNQNPKYSEPKFLRRRFKFNQMVFNVCLVILHHPKIKDNREKENELVSAIMDFTFKECNHKVTKDLQTNPQLLNLAYHIIKRVLKISDPIKQDEYFEEIKKKSIESMRHIAPAPDGNRNNDVSDIISIWLTILLFRLIYETKCDTIRDQIDCLQKLAKTFCDQIMPKKINRDNPISEESIVFDENEDILDKLFSCPHMDILDYKNQTVRVYNKGYSILTTRILVKLLDKQSFNINESIEPPANNPIATLPTTLMDIFTNLLKLPSFDYEIKIETLMLIRCLIIPQTVKSKVYKHLTKDKDFLSLNMKLQIMNILKPDQVTVKNEWKLPTTRMFLDHYWQLIIDFIE